MTQDELYRVRRDDVTLAIQVSNGAGDSLGVRHDSLRGQILSRTCPDEGGIVWHDEDDMYVCPLRRI